MADWNKRLRAARRDLGLSTADLATRAGLSVASVRAYETGRRHPTREHLSQILDCLRLDRQTRNEVLVDAGLAPQLLLEAAMAGSGAFGPEIAGKVAELVYWHLTGGFSPGDSRTILL
jgi:transcriptional regulator with XRE-family HTH domain